MHGSRDKSFITQDPLILASIWADIHNGDTWDRAYLPYYDEPLRMNGIQTPLHNSRVDQGDVKFMRKVLKQK